MIATFSLLFGSCNLCYSLSLVCLSSPKLFIDSCNQIKNMSKEKNKAEDVWMESSFTLSDFTLSYLHTKSSSSLPPLIFLHAFTSTGPRQLHIFSKLTDSFQIFLPTARGHGKSTPIPRNSFTMENLVNDVQVFIRHVSPDQPVFLVGHSMGASTAARVAKQFPHLICGLVLEDPPWRRKVGEPFHAPLGKEGPLGLLEIAETVKSMTEEEFEKVKYESPFKLFPPPAGKSSSSHMHQKEFDNKRSSQQDENKFDKQFGQAQKQEDLPPTGPGDGPFAQSMLEGLRQLDVTVVKEIFINGAEKYIVEAVEEIKVPTLLLTGEPGKAHCTPEIATASLNTWSNGKERNFPGAGHGIHSGRWQLEFIEVIRTFFNGILSSNSCST